MRTRRPFLICAMCASYAAYCLSTSPPGPVSAPGSAGYLAFSPIHVLGYPIFLRVAGAAGAMIWQPLIFAATLASLGLQTLQLTSSAAIAGVAAGLAATVRRTGLALLPVVPIMVWLDRRRLARPHVVLALGLLPAVAVIGLERIAARAVHGDRLASLAGRHVYAKAAMLDAPPADRRSADQTRASLEHDLEVLYQPIRDLIRRAPGDVAGVLTLITKPVYRGRACHSSACW